MAGNDREPIGRKGKPSRPVKRRSRRRSIMMMTMRMKNRCRVCMAYVARGKARLVVAIAKTVYRFVVLFAIYGVYLISKNPQPY